MTLSPLAWSFGGVEFYWFKQENGGAPTNPDWQQPSRLVIRDMLGGGDADIARIGKKASEISGTIWVSTANAGALRALDGSSAILTDGTVSWRCVMEATINPLVSGGWYVGTAKFTRARR